MLPKVESSPSKLQYTGSDGQQALPSDPPAQAETSLDVKHEAKHFSTEGVFPSAHGPFKSPAHIQNVKTALKDDHYKTLTPSYSGDLIPQNSTVPSHALVPSPFLIQTDTNTHQAHQTDYDTFSSLWPPQFDESYLHSLLPETAQSGDHLGEWSAMTQLAQSPYAHYIDSLFGSAFPYIFSNQEPTLLDQSPVAYTPLTQSLDPEISYLHPDQREYYSHQCMQEPSVTEATLSQPSNHDPILHGFDVSVASDSMGVSCRYLNEFTPSLSPRQWPAQQTIHDTITEDHDSSSLTQEPSNPHQWNQTQLSIAAHSPHDFQDGHSVAGTVTVKSETHSEDGIVVQSPSTRSPENHAAVDIQAPSIHKPLIPQKSSLRPRTRRPVHGDLDPTVLFVCQSSRQKPQEAATGTSETNLKPRKAFGEDQRQETSRTRDVGACVRCKMQRVRVSTYKKKKKKVSYYGMMTAKSKPNSVDQTWQIQTVPASRASRWPVIRRRRSFTTSAVTVTNCRRLPFSGRLPRQSTRSVGRLPKSEMWLRTGNPWL